MIENNQLSLFTEPSEKKYQVSVSRVFRYPGSKALASKHFSRCIPSHTREVISPFFGGGSFEMYLSARHIRVYGADLFEPLVNLWHFILNDNERLAQRCHEILVQSNKEILLEYQKEKYFKIEDKFEQAAYFWIFLCISWNGMAFSGIKDYRIIDNEVQLVRYPESYTIFYKRLQVFYNPFISIDYRDYRDHLNKYPNHFVYLDPPYPDVGNLYGNSSEFHDDFNHEELRDILLNRDSLWILSYNDKPIIRELYDNENFIVKEKWWKQRNNSHKQAEELVIFPKHYDKDLLRTTEVYS